MTSTKLTCDEVVDEIILWMGSNVKKETLQDLGRKHDDTKKAKKQFDARGVEHEVVVNTKAAYEATIEKTAKEIYADGEVCEELRNLLGQLSSWQAHPTRFRAMQQTHRSGLREALNQLVWSRAAASAPSLEGVAA